MTNKHIECECKTHLIEVYRFEDEDLVSLIFWEHQPAGRYPMRVILGMIWRLLRDGKLSVAEIILNPENKKELIKLLKKV